MTILQLCSDDDRRGAQVFAAELGDRLQELGHDVVTVGLAKGAVGGLDMRVLGSSRFDRGALGALRGLMQRSDVVVAHGSTTLPASALAGLGVSTPVVYRQISDPAYWTPTLAKRARVAAYYRFPRHVVALSPATRQVMVDRFRVPERKISVIPNAVDERRHKRASEGARTNARAKLGLDPDDVVVAYVGALVEEKGVGDLIAAAQPGWKLVFAGDGRGRFGFEEAARQRALDVRFLGPVADPTQVYAAADVFVLPSWSEQQPGVLIEAALAGVPCVVTDVGLTRELMDDGYAALMVPTRDRDALGQAIAELLADPRRRRTIAARATQHLQRHHTLAAVAPQWAKLLARVAE